MELIKQAAPASVLVGGTVTYTLTAINHGPTDAINLSINDQLPAGFTVDVGSIQIENTSIGFSGTVDLGGGSGPVTV